MPYLLVDGQDIFDKLKMPKFHLLLFSNDERECRTVCEEFERKFGHVADCHVVPLDSRVREIFETGKEFSVFLRPDNHIAVISPELSPNAAQDYLHRIAER